MKKILLIIWDNFVVKLTAVESSSLGEQIG
jgi:hypothetical protein